MKTIRTKIIAIFLVIVLLPMLPIAWLVNDLLRHSYRLGVNPEVEQVLQQSVNSSRDLYQRRKLDLSERLETDLRTATIRQLLKNKPEHSLKALLPAAPPDWQLLELQIYDDAGKMVWQSLPTDSTAGQLMDLGHLAQLRESAGGRLVIAHRDRNHFVALESRPVDGLPYHLALSGRITDDFLQKSDNLLELHQRYQLLNTAPVSVPGTLIIAFSWISIVILGITIAIAVWLSRKLTAPLDDLVKGTREIGRGNLDYHIPQNSRDEIGDLARHFNRMTGELKTFQERTIYLEKMAAWQEIARRLAHEIKNPLTPIQLTMQEMVDRYQGNDDEYQKLLTECHGIIHEEIENLRRLVREFSAFGRMPEPQMEMHNINELIGDLQKLYPHYPVKLDLDSSLPEILCDEDRIRRVLINLIENAVQADAGKQPVNIATRFRDEWVEVSVRDQGPGMPAEVREKVFQPYFSTKANGIGLGLAITRKMIEEHNGTIRVDSSPGKGSRFLFTLPVVRR